MELNYAPPARNPNRVILVIAAGIVTTVLTLVGVYYSKEDGGGNIMGWHVDYVLPAGAVVVGVCASLGYGIASYLTGLKIRKGLLWFILALQFVAYFGAEYVTFASQGPLFLDGSTTQLTFPEYFNYTATHFAWKSDDEKKAPGKPLGGAGYFFIGLEILGFAAGSLIVPAALMKHPYCELCQMYMKRKKLTTFAASVPFRKVKKNDLPATEAYNAEQQAAYKAGQSRLAAFSQFAAQGNAAALREDIDALKPATKAAGSARRTIGRGEDTGGGLGSEPAPSRSKMAPAAPATAMTMARWSERVARAAAAPAAMPRLSLLLTAERPRSTDTAPTKTPSTTMPTTLFNTGTTPTVAKHMPSRNVARA